MTDPRPVAGRPLEIAALTDRWGPGVTVLASQDGAAVLATGDPAERYDLASLTKPLFAYGVLIAVEERVLTLDEPCGPPGSTVRHLLSHAGGLPFEPGYGPTLAAESKRVYSNLGFEVLAERLERGAQMPWANYLDAALVGPLSLTVTWGSSPAHGAWGSGSDLAAFVAEVRRPTLLDPTTVADATTVQFPSLRGRVPGVGAFNPNPWGLGFEIRGAKRPHWTGHLCSPRTFGHFGRTGCFWWFDPDADRSLIGLGRRGFGPWALEVWPLLADAAFAT